jgi:hypothetical protein
MMATITNASTRLLPASINASFIFSFASCPYLTIDVKLELFSFSNFSFRKRKAFTEFNIK